MSTPVAATNTCSQPEPPKPREDGGGGPPKIFNSQDFIEFLRGQDISQLAVLTKNGTLVSAKFDAGNSIDPSVFQSDLFKSIEGLPSPAFETSNVMVRPEPSSSRATSITTAEDVSVKTGASGNQIGLPGLSTVLASQDWKNDYKQSHVDVSYPAHFFSKSELPPPPQASSAIPAIQGSGPSEPGAASATTVLPPKKQPGTTDWKAMFYEQLSPLVEAASRQAPMADEEPGPATAAPAPGFHGIPPAQAQLQLPQPGTAAAALPKSAVPHPQDQPSVSSSGDSIPGTKTGDKISTATKPAHKRKPRKIVPEVKEFVDIYTDYDVLFGRGGRSNHHPGNKIYREKVTENQDHYRQNCVKNEKTKVAQRIVDFIVCGGGRFLELDQATKRWYVVPNIMARRKVGQALRENNTEEARQAKREKYGQNKPKKEQ